MAKTPKWKKAAVSRDAGSFVAMPWAVLDSPAYQDLSHPAKALLHANTSATTTEC